MLEEMTAEGILRKQITGRWAICRDGEDPLEITSGDAFFLEIPNSGAMVRTRMEYGHIHGQGQYYSIGGYELREGLRAGFVGKGLFGAPVPRYRP